MKDQYLVRRDVLDRIHQNPNAVPIVYPDDFGARLAEADLPALVRDAVARLGLPALGQDAMARLASFDKQRLVNDGIKGHRDLMGYLDRRGYDNDSAESYAAWAMLWDGISNWDNRQWNWQEIGAAVALVDLFCPVVEEREAVVLARGSTGH